MYQIDNHDPEKTFLVGTHLRSSSPLLTIEESLSELALLAKTAGLTVIGQITQNLNQIDPATYIGSGKVEEIIDALDETGAKTVIFDDELSPRHQRELSNRLGKEINLLDRSALILDIFARHARTREGALQVELAQYEYRLPRLTRQWTHLARQAGGGSARGGAGGVGLRGPGETQLEVDRREISRKITKLKEELELVRQHRSRHRARRRKTGIPVVALVGYTNAGKSTLLNAISDSDVYVADQLFATLDPTTRRVSLPSGRQILITDTVGFIQKLPPTLIAAFRATLEEIREADLILHVVDVSHPEVLAHIDAVEETLAEINVPDGPRIMIWNKLDRLSQPSLPHMHGAEFYNIHVKTSALTGEGVDDLLIAIEKTISQTMRRVTICLPFERGDLVSKLYDTARVLHQEHVADGVILDVELPMYLYEQVREFEQSQDT